MHGRRDAVKTACGQGTRLALSRKEQPVGNWWAGRGRDPEARSGG